MGASESGVVVNIDNAGNSPLTHTDQNSPKPVNTRQNGKLVELHKKVPRPSFPGLGSTPSATPYIVTRLVPVAKMENAHVLGSSVAPARTPLL